MRTKHVLAATVAAWVLAAGGIVQAQDTTKPRATDPGTSMQNQSTTPSTGSAADKSAASLERSTLHEIKSDTAMAQGLNVNAKDLSGMDIYGSDGKKIGDVNKVLGDSSNAIKAVTVDVGGFLGIGAREVILPIDKLQKGTEKDRLQVSMSKTDLENLEKWENPDRDAGGRAPAGSPAPATPPTR